MSADVSPALRATFAGRTAQADSKKQVLSALHAVVREIDWTLGAQEWDAIARSFHVIRASGRGFDGAILLEADAAVVTLCDGQPAMGNLDFVDDPAFTDAATRYGFHVLAPEELAQELSAADKAFVAAHDPRYIGDLKYWRPRTVGEVIFNYWD